MRVKNNVPATMGNNLQNLRDDFRMTIGFHQYPQGWRGIQSHDEIPSSGQRPRPAQNLGVGHNP